MGNSRNTGYLQNAVKVADNGDISLMHGSTMLMQISSSGAITTTGVISGSNALSASYAATASFVTTAQTASFVTLAQTASFVANAQSASNAVTAQTASFANSLTVAGTLTAQTLVIQTITSSVSTITGSTSFGSTGSNTHDFTGSVTIDKSLYVSNNISTGSFPFSISAVTEPYVINTNSSKSLYEQAGTALTFVSRNPNYIGSSAFLISLLAYTSSVATNVYFGVVAGTTGNGPANFVIGRRTGTSTWNESLRIDTTGNIGIGTTNPGSRLTVRGTDSVSMLYLGISGSSSNGEAVGITFGSATYDKARIVAYNENSGNAAGYLTLWTGGSPTTTDITERMRITSAGNVGIGTNSPVSTNLVGSVTIRKSYGGDSTNGATTQDYYLNQSALYLFGRNSTLSMISNNSEEGEIIFGNNSTRAYARISTGTGASAVGGDMYFKVGSDVERMRITTAGRIGIGTNNPVLNVDIVSGSADTIKLRVRNTNATGSAGIILNPEGAGAGSLGDATLFYDVHTTAWVAGVDKSDSSKYKIANDVYGDFRANNYFTITTGGNVGIGLTAPSAKLHVYGTTTVFNMLLENSTSDAYSVYQAKTGNSSLWQWGVWNNNSYRVGVSGVADYLTITSGGNVLVGQTTSDLGQNGWNLQSAGGGHTAFAINNNEAFIFNNRNTGTTYEIDFRTNATERGKISVTDSGVSYITTPSDLNLKKNFENWNENVLDNFKNLNPQKFNFKVEEDDQPKTKGFIAQELVESFPEAYPKSKDRYFFNPSGMVVYLMKAIQEQQAQIEELKAKING